MLVIIQNPGQVNMLADNITIFFTTYLNSFNAFRVWLIFEVQQLGFMLMVAT